MASDLTWIEIDPTQLSAEAQGKLALYREAYRAMKAAKGEFEAAAREDIPVPEGFEARFGYNFGKLSFALAKATPKAQAKPKLDLKSYIAMMQQSGHAV